MAAIARGRRAIPTTSTPEEALQVFEDVGGRLFLPIHFGTFDMTATFAGARPPDEGRRRGRHRGARRAPVARSVDPLVVARRRRAARRLLAPAPSCRALRVAESSRIRRIASRRAHVRTRPARSRASRRSRLRLSRRRGRRVRAGATLARIRALAFAAWTDVWIAPRRRVTSRRSAATPGRKQYRYHARWREVRDETKYTRVLAFARALPGIRARLRTDLARPGCRATRCWPPSCGCSRRRSFAWATKRTRARIARSGSRRCATATSAFAAHPAFHFRGKGGKNTRWTCATRGWAHRSGLPDLRPGAVPVIDDTAASEPRSATSTPICARSRRGVHAKDFARGRAPCWPRSRWRSASFASGARPRNITRAVESVAARLGNTPTISRKCYVHPA